MFGCSLAQDPKPRKVIGLDSAKIEVCAPEAYGKDKPHCFSITTATGYEAVFAADTAEEANKARAAPRARGWTRGGR